MTEIKPSLSIWRERRTLIATLSLVYTALFMPAILYVQPGDNSLIDLAIPLAGAFVYSWAFFFTVRAWRGLFMMLTPLVFFASAIASYFIWQFHFEMTYQQLGVITEIQPKTAFAFISAKLVLWVLVATSIGLILTRRSVRLEERDPKDARLLFITGILMVCIFTTEAGSITQRYFPYNLLFSVKDFVAEKISIARGKPIANAPVSYAATAPVTVILIVGESVRAANWGLNGYARQTTPLLAKRDGIMNFTDVLSCYPLTRVAVPCIATNNSYKHAVTPEYSLLQLFKKMDFFTASIDMHGMSQSVFGSPVSALFNTGERLISFNGSMLSSNNVDDAGVEALKQLLAEHNQNLFVLFHPFGSHWPYDTRYPERFRVHTPVCNPLHHSLLNLAKDMSECVSSELVNAYDNSILYADFITNEVMDAVKGRAAIVLYTSDHGQSLGENGLFLHGHEDAAMERHVPLVVWATPEFTARFSPALARMKAKQHTPTSHDTIFHSLLDCVGAKGTMIDPKLSLCH